MTDSQWFSTRLRFAIIIETQGLVRYSDSVHLLRAADFDEAFNRALVIGRKNERAYVNGDGQSVVWKLSEVTALDILQDGLFDGVEVYSEPVSGTEPSWSIQREFHPEASRPTQTV